MWSGEVHFIWLAEKIVYCNVFADEIKCFAVERGMNRRHEASYCLRVARWFRNAQYFCLSNLGRWGEGGGRCESVVGCGLLPLFHSDTAGKEVLYFCWFSTNLSLLTNLLTLISKVPSSYASSSPLIHLFSSRLLFCIFIFLFYFPLSVPHYLSSSFLDYFYALYPVLILFLLSILLFLLTFVSSFLLFPVSYSFPDLLSFLSPSSIFLLSVPFPCLLL